MLMYVWIPLQAPRANHFTIVISITNEKALIAHQRRPPTARGTYNCVLIRWTATSHLSI